MAFQRRDLDQGARRILVVLLAIAASVAFALPALAGPTEAELAMELDVPAELVWAVLTDYEAWPRVFPSLRRVAVESREGDLVRIRHETRSMGIDVRFTTLTRADAGALRMESSLDTESPHDLAAMRSQWQVTRLSEGRVRVELRSGLDAGDLVPGFIQRRLVRQSVSDTLEALAEELGRRAVPAFAEAGPEAPAA